MRLHQFQLYLFPLDDLRCGFGIQQGNILPSLPYIPGRVVRGGLAGWAVRRGLKNDIHLFKGLFLSEPEAQYEQLITFPNCTYRGCKPTPLSLFSEKGTAKPPLASLLESRRTPIHKGALPSTGGPTDFLRRNEFPAQVDMTLKPVSGQVDIITDFVTPSPPLKVDLRNHHEENGSVGENGLFAEEVLPAANALLPEDHYYSGTLLFEDKAVIHDVFLPLVDTAFLDRLKRPKQGILDTPDPFRMVFMGHHRVPVFAFADDLGVTDTDTDKLPGNLQKAAMEKEFSWTALSDFIPAMGPDFPLSDKMLENHLAIRGVKGQRVFCARDLAHGYDAVAGKPLLPDQTIAAGSCGFFCCSVDEKASRSLWEKSLVGLGKRTRDGFGKFEVNWDIHEINAGA